MLVSEGQRASGVHIYEEIPEYEDLNANRQRPRGAATYQNTEAENKVYVSLNPSVMEAIRKHIKAQKQKKQEAPAHLPAPIYEEAYSHMANRRPVLRMAEVHTYVNQLQQEINKQKKKYQVL